MQTTYYLVLLVVTVLLSMHISDAVFLLQPKNETHADGTVSVYCELNRNDVKLRLTDKPYYDDIDMGPMGEACMHCAPCTEHGSSCHTARVTCEELKAAQAAKESEK